MLDLASPPAVRGRQASWLDPRLLGGLLLILVSLVVGARVVSAADRGVPVYAARVDLSAGHVIAAADVQAVQVRLSAVERYVGAGDSVVGRVVTRGIRTGELLPAAAVASTAPAPFRDVSLVVKPEHIAESIISGSKVDVIATGPAPSGGRQTWTVARGLEVVYRSKPSGGFASNDSRVVLKVPTELVLALTAAMRTADLDVVRVPQLDDPGDIGDQVAPVGPASTPQPASSPAGAP